MLPNLGLWPTVSTRRKQTQHSTGFCCTAEVDSVCFGLGISGRCLQTWRKFVLSGCSLIWRELLTIRLCLFVVCNNCLRQTNATLSVHAYVRYWFISDVSLILLGPLCKQPVTSNNPFLPWFTYIFDIFMNTTRKRGKAQHIARPECANSTVHFLLTYKLAMLVPPSEYL